MGPRELHATRDEPVAPIRRRRAGGWTAALLLVPLGLGAPGARGADSAALEVSVATRPPADGRGWTRASASGSGATLEPGTSPPVGSLVWELHERTIEGTALLRPPDDAPSRGDVRIGQECVRGPGGGASFRGWVDTAASASTSARDGFTVEVAGRFPWEDLHPPGRTAEAEVPAQGLGRLTVSRAWSGIGHVRAGRYTPDDVPAIGRIDGCQGVIHASPSVRAGVLAGLRPEGGESAVAADRPVAAGWVAWAGGSETVRCTATAAVLGTVYEGRVDRVACVTAHRLDLGGHLEFAADAELDIQGLDARSIDPALGLTALRLEAGAPLGSRVTLRLGTDHRKLPDTREERAAAGGGEGDPRFTAGSWSHWLGASWRLPWDVELDARCWLDEPAGSERPVPGWRWAIRRRGIPGLPGGTLRASMERAFGGEPWESSARVGAELGLLEDRLRLGPSVGASFRREDDRSGRARLTDISLDMTWRLGRSAGVSAGAAYAFAGSGDLVARVGLECTF